MFMSPTGTETARRGREHLVESAQCARLYLVIRDSNSAISTYEKAPLGAFSPPHPIPHHHSSHLQRLVTRKL